MSSAVLDLFRYTRARVTEQDIVDFSPGDPGYGSYVKVWTEIRRTGVIPEQTEFDLSEVIGLTGWARPEDWEAAERFRRYRRFTTSVGIALLHLGNDSEMVRPANYLARELIIDWDRADSGHLALIREVASATREYLLADGSENEYPFFTFAGMVLGQLAGDWPGAEEAATQLIVDEGAVRRNEALNWLIVENRFLLGLTNYNQLHGDWIVFADGLSNPNGHEDTQLVIDALKAGAGPERRFVR